MFNKFNKGKITTGQFYIILISIMIGTGILNLAREVSKISMQDGWISVIIAGIVVTASTYIALYVSSKFDDDSFLQCFFYLLSKPLAFIILLFYFLYSLAVSSAVLRSLADMIITWFLPRTPIWVILLLALVTVINVAKDGLPLIGRFCQIIFYTIIPISFLIIVPVYHISLLNVLPIGGSGISKIAEGIQLSIFTYAGYEVSLFLFPFIANKNKNIAKMGALTVFLVALIYTITVFSQIALFGYQELQTLMYPTINYLDVIDIPIIERIEIFFSIFWIFTVIVTVIVQYYVGSLILQSLFNTRNNSGFIYMFSPLVFFLSLYPRSSVQIGAYKEIIGYCNIFFGLALPVILLITFLLKGGKKKDGKKD